MDKVKIITYKDIRDVSGAIQEGRIIRENEALITATGDIASAIKGIKPGELDDSVLEMNILFMRLMPDWYSEETNLEDFLALGEYIEALGDRISQDERKSLQKYRVEMLKSMGVLLELGIKPEILPDKSQREKLFRDTYQYYCNNADSAKKLAMQVKAWESGTNFKANVNRIAVNRNPKEAKVYFSSIKRLYFLGFYYVTPMQARVIRAFERAGYDIVFLNNIDHDYETAYDVFRNNEFFQGITEQALDAAAGLKKRDAGLFGRERNVIGETKGIRIRKFSDTFSFVEYLGRVKESPIEIFSPNGKDIKEFAEMFFPEDGERRLMAYPVGQYLYQLYKMWDDDLKAPVFPVDAVRNCLASGCVGRNSKGGSRILAVFDRAKEFFTDCITLKQWQERISLIEEVQKEILPLFHGHNGKSRWDKVLASPLSYIGTYNLENEEVNLLKEGLLDIFDDARMLFGNEWIDLKSHFEKLSKIINSRVDTKTVSEEERKAVGKLVWHLKERPGHIKQCRAGDLAEAMQYYLGGNLKKEEDENGLVGKGLMSAEAAILEGKKSALVCFCDEFHLPELNRGYPWPLSRELLDNLQNVKGVDRDLIQYYIYFRESAKYEGRYLFFLSMQLENVEYSWIEASNKEKVNPSVYIELLHTAGAINIEEIEDYAPAKGNGVDSLIEGPEQDEISCFVPEDLDGADFPEIEYNSRICCWRNFYDYGISRMPEYVSRFQMQFYVSNLCRTIKAIMGNAVNSDEAGEKVFKILPFWNKAEQKEILNFSRNGLINMPEFDLGETKWEGRSYYLTRLYLKYLHPALIREMVANNIRRDACIFCPHNTACFYRYKKSLQQEN